MIPHGSPVPIQRDAFDDRGRVIERQSFDDDGNPTAIEHWREDDAGNVLEHDWRYLRNGDWTHTRYDYSCWKSYPAPRRP